MAAFNVTRRYGDISSSSGNEIAFAPTSDFSSSGFAVLLIGNESSSFGVISVSDTKGNSWELRDSHTYTDVDDVNVAVLTTLMDGGVLTTGDTITIASSGTLTTSLIQLLDVTTDSGYVADYAASGHSAGATTTTPTVTSSSIASGDAIIGYVMFDLTTPTVGPDADTTNGSWSSFISVYSGYPSGIGARLGYQSKNVTGTGEQTYNPTIAESEEVIVGWISLTAVFDTNRIRVSKKNIAVAGKQVALWSGRRVSVGTASITVAAGSAGLTLNRYVIRPSADSVDGNWTTESGGTDLYAAIDESVASTSDYIQSPSNPVDEVCKIKLDIPSIGASIPAQPMVVAYQFGKSADGAPLNLTVRLLQGATEIAAWTESDITTSWVTRERTLTTMQFNSISDFDDLYLEFTGDMA